MLSLDDYISFIEIKEKKIQSEPQHAAGIREWLRGDAGRMAHDTRIEVARIKSCIVHWQFPCIKLLVQNERPGPIYSLSKEYS